MSARIFAIIRPSAHGAPVLAPASRAAAAVATAASAPGAYRGASATLLPANIDLAFQWRLGLWACSSSCRNRRARVLPGGTAGGRQRRLSQSSRGGSRWAADTRMQERRRQHRSGSRCADRTSASRRGCVARVRGDGKSRFAHSEPC